VEERGAHMTQGQIDSITAQLRQMNTLLTELAAGQRAQAQELADIKTQVNQTNGRVTQLEAQEIREQAVADERAKHVTDMERREEQGTAARWRIQDRLIGATVTLGAVVIGAVLADLRFF